MIIRGRIAPPTPAGPHSVFASFCQGGAENILGGGRREPRPVSKADPGYGDEVHRLNEDLLQAAFRLTKDIELADSDAAKAYRAKYAEAAATAPPQVSICDTISSDTWWFGDRLAEAMAASARLI